MESNANDDDWLQDEIQQLMQEAKRIQEEPMGFLQGRQHLIGHWMGQSINN